MRKPFTFLVLVAFVASIFMVGCSKQAEVGFGGEVKTAPGGKAPPPGKPQARPDANL